MGYKHMDPMQQQRTRDTWGCEFEGRRGLLTVDGGLPRQDYHHQLETLVGVLEVLEHGLHAVRSLGILAEAGLALDGHARVSRDLPQLVCKCSATDVPRC